MRRRPLSDGPGPAAAAGAGGRIAARAPDAARPGIDRRMAGPRRADFAAILDRKPGA